MQIIPLGTNGFFSSFNRQTACYVIPHNETLIILDAGSGMFRFAEPEGQRLLKNASAIHLYLSHYHLDHTFGFYAASTLFRGKTVAVFGKSDKKVFSDMQENEYTGGNFEERHKNFTWHALSAGTHAMDGYSVSVRTQHHNGAGSLAFRFAFSDRTLLSYVTDSEPTTESVSFCKESNLLLHEHYFPGQSLYQTTPLTDHFQGGHTTTVGAALVAKEAGVKHLALIHHQPTHSNTQLEDQLTLAKNIFPTTFLAKDLHPIEG